MAQTKKSSITKPKKITLEDLKDLGFKKVSEWYENPDKAGFVKYLPISDNEILRADKILYAFIVDNKIKYIGQTALGISKRFGGYLDPGERRTNKKCSDKILAELRGGKKVFIWAHTPPLKDSLLSYLEKILHLECDVNLAISLEKGLIKRLKEHDDDCWNGRQNKPKELLIQNINRV